MPGVMIGINFQISFLSINLFAGAAYEFLLKSQEVYNTDPGKPDPFLLNYMPVRFGVNLG
jgi:hypothetical protein